MSNKKITGSAVALGETPAETSQSNTLLPLKNVFHDYKSVKYDFTLSALPKDVYNTASYRDSPGKIGNVILQSSDSSQTLTKVTLPDQFGSSAEYQFNFYIDNVTISTICGLNYVTGNSNATKFQFTITEPYSMGMFPIALQNAAKSADYLNWVDAVYLLTVKFFGQEEVSSSSKEIDDTIRFFPIKLIDITMEVSASGAVYECEAVPFNELSLFPDIVVLKDDLRFSASTVGDALSQVEVLLNNQLSKLKIPHSISIEFPGESNSDPTTGSGISLSKIVTGNNKSDSTNIETGTIDVGKVLFTFGKGTTVVEVINQVVANSEFAARALKQLKENSGIVNLIKVEPQVSFKDTSKSTSLIDAKKYTFRVIEYKADATRVAKPGSTIDRVTQFEPVKEYDYIFTGKNLDIFDLKLSFNNMFRLLALADNQSENTDARFSQQSASFSNVSNSKSLDYIQNVINSVGVPIDPAKARQSILGTQDQSSASKDSVPYVVMPVTTRTTLYSRGSGGTGTLIPSDSPAADSIKEYRKLYDAMLTPVDLVQATMKVAGDIYFLSDNGYGNTFFDPLSNTNLTLNNQMNLRTADTFIKINYKTPIDIDPTTGMFTQVASLPILNGLFYVTTVESNFSKGVFTQELSLSRRLGQYKDDATASPKVEMYDLTVQSGTKYA